MPKYEDITVKLTGKDGNAFLIMGTVSKAMRRNDIPDEEVQNYINECMNSGSYDELLRITMETVNVE